MSNNIERTAAPSGPYSDPVKRLHTADGHLENGPQASLSPVHQTFASPSPLGLLSFATGMV